MGLFDQILGGGGQPQRKPGFGDTVAMGVILALLVKAVRSYQASHGGPPGTGRSFDPARQPAGAGTGGGLGGILGGMLGGGSAGAGGGGLGSVLGGSGGLGSVLGGLGGAGALNALLEKLRQGGLGSQADSWVQRGPNQAVSPQQLGSALGDNTVQALQQQTGLDRQALLSELSQALPQAVDEATPEGHEPDDAELHQIAQRPAPSA